MDLQVDLRGCLAGRKDAWDDFVRASAPVIHAAVQRACRSRGSMHQSDIDDRIQEVYVRLLREEAKLLRNFDPKRASLVTWLSIIARTVVHEHFQKKRMPTTGLDADNLDPAVITSDDHANPPYAELSPPVSLDVLTAQQRQVIEMLFEQDMSVEQAAARLQVDPQTIRSAKHKALSRLREAMFKPDKPNPGSRSDPAVTPPASPHPHTPTPSSRPPAARRPPKHR